MAVYDANTEPEPNAGLLRGRACYAGMDLSSTTDLTALELYVPDEEGGGTWLHHYFVPEENLRKRAERDRVPYDVWEEQAHLVATPGNVVDYDYIRETLNALRDDGFEIQEVGYDPWNAIALVTDGFTCVPIRQGFASLAAPTKEFEKLLLARKMRFGRNPVTRWAASNVTPRPNTRCSMPPVLRLGVLPMLVPKSAPTSDAG